MRILGILLLIAGALHVWAWPALQGTLNNFEIGKYRIYDNRVGYVPVENLALSADDLPLKVRIFAQATVKEYPPSTTTSMALRIASSPLGGKAVPEFVVDEVISFRSAPFAIGPETSSSLTFDIELEAITRLAEGDYTITAAPQEMNDLEIEHVDLTLVGRFARADGDRSPIGYALMGAGALALVFGGRRRKGRKRRSRRDDDDDDDDDDDEDDEDDDDDDDDDDDERRKKRRRPKKTSQIGRRVPVDAPRQKPKPKVPQRKWGRGE
ncbi:MAG: hypothetical protein AAFP99_08600 [Pseudomonadota bacterium]